jgi:23S rRNA (pseudouridine1915-N3)-methyltransferase
MKVLILAIGKIKSRPVAELAADYAARLGHYAPLEMVACRDEAGALAKLAPTDRFIVLDERGKERTSAELAQFLAEHRGRGVKRLAFFIGGPEGVGQPLRARADELFALSRMTLPHELAQAVLLEQLYRASTILKGEPYHK